MNMTMPSPMEGSHHITDVHYFDPDETLITILKRAISNRQDILLKAGDGGEVLLLGCRGEYFSQIADEQGFFASPVGAVDITILHKDDHRIPAADIIGRNIDELMWKAAFYSSQGRLMQGCYPVDMVELAYWPNLSRLPHTSNAPRIAALLSDHPTTIAIAARVLKILPEELYQFYSAARCAGLARPVNRTPEEPKLEPHRHQTMLSALLKKISSL